MEQAQILKTYLPVQIGYYGIDTPMYLHTKTLVRKKQEQISVAAHTHTN